MEPNPYPHLVHNAIWHPVTALLRANTDVSRDIFVSDGYYRVRAVRESHSVASTSGTLQVEVLTSGQDADAGVDQLTTTMSLSGTADTPIAGTVIADPTVITPGDRVGVVLGGTLTNLINALVTVYLERIQRGNLSP